VVDFENRIWAEREIEKGRQFITRFGKGIGFETINDTVLKLAQKMGYVLVVRKDPRKGYVRIKTLPDNGSKGADLTLAYEQLKKIDPEATWYLHVSGKMLLNGTPKNPKMIPTKLSLEEIIKVLERI
jgi:D-arabinose 1-dehydrogenase-like Zn-dependent alcohol dehydrogenase